MNCMRYVTNILMTFSLVLGLSGCQSASSYVPELLTKSNFKRAVYIVKDDLTFHHAVYEGPELNCFPPIQNRECRVGGTEVGSYKETDGVRVENFWINVSTKIPLLTDESKEFLYLVASELTIQRGFKYFTLASIRNFDECDQSVVAGSSGSVYSGASGYGSFSGSSKARVVSDCTYRTTFSIYLFDDGKIFLEGLFSKPGPDSPINSNKLLPVMELYNYAHAGAIPNTHFLNDERKSITGGTERSSVHVVRDAWRIKYDAVGLAADIRKKNSMLESPENPRYKFVDFSKRNASIAKKYPHARLNPIENNRSISP